MNGSFIRCINTAIAQIRTPSHLSSAARQLPAYPLTPDRLAPQRRCQARLLEGSEERSATRADDASDEIRRVLDVIRLSGPHGHSSVERGAANELRKNAAISLRNPHPGIALGECPSSKELGRSRARPCISRHEIRSQLSCSRLSKLTIVSRPLGPSRLVLGHARNSHQKPPPRPSSHSGKSPFNAFLFDRALFPWADLLDRYLFGPKALPQLILRDVCCPYPQPVQERMTP